MVAIVLNKRNVKMHESKLMELMENIDIFTIITGHFNLHFTLTGKSKKERKYFRISKI